MPVQIFLWDPLFSSFGYIPRRRLAGSYGNSVFNFLRNHRTIFHSGCTILPPTVWPFPLTVHKGSLHPHQRNAFVFDSGHPSEKKKTIHKITIAQLVKNPSAMQERSWLHSWVRKISWRRDRLSIPVFLGFPGGSVGKESACSGRRSGFDPWVGKITSSRKWQPTPVFLPGEFHGQRSLAGNSPWGCKELDTTKRLILSLYLKSMYGIIISAFYLMDKSQIYFLRAHSRHW